MKINLLYSMSKYGNDEAVSVLQAMLQYRLNIFIAMFLKNNCNLFSYKYILEYSNAISK